MDTIEAFVPQHLRRWTRPEHYFGQEWSELYAFMGRNRDSGILDTSNWECAISALARGKETCESNTVRIVHEGHWAVGWVEWIAIHESDDAALRIADKLAGRLANYPILDESDFTQREEDACAECWGENPPSRFTLSNRAHYLRSVRERYPDVSFFQIRRPWGRVLDAHDEAHQWLRSLLLE